MSVCTWAGKTKQATDNFDSMHKINDETRLAIVYESIYATRLLNLLKGYVEHSLTFKSLIYDFFKATELNLQKPLISSLPDSHLNEDIVIHALIYESKTHRIARDYFVFEKRSKETIDDLKIMGLVLAIVIIQKHNGRVKKIEKYLSDLFQQEISIINYAPNLSERQDLLACEYLDDVSDFLLDEIMHNLRENAINLTEDGFNRALLDLDNGLAKMNVDSKEILRQMHLIDVYAQESIEVQDEEQKLIAFEAAIKEADINGQGNNFKNILPELIDNTFEAILHGISMFTDTQNNSTKNDRNAFAANEEMLIKEKKAVHEVFASNAKYGQIKKDKHYMSFFLKCNFGFDTHTNKYILQDFYEAMVTGVIFKSIIDAYAKDHNHNQERIFILKKTTEGLSFFNVDAPLMESFKYIVENYKNSHYIKYVLLAKRFDLSMETIGKYRKAIGDSKTVLRKDTFEKYSEHIFNAIHLYKRTNKNDALIDTY